MGSDRLLYLVLGVIAVGAILLMWNHDAGQTLGIDNSSFSRLIWLGTLGLVIGTGILARGRLNGSATLQQIAIWLAVFLALMVGYRLYHGEPLFPGSNPSPPVQSEGIVASLTVESSAG